MYYFDHSATTPVHSEVSELVDSIQSTIYGNPSSIYSAGQKAKSVIENARRQIADSISVEPEQIIFTSGATESVNLVAHAYGRPHINKNDVIFLLTLQLFSFRL